MDDAAEHGEVSFELTFLHAPLLRQRAAAAVAAAIADLDREYPRDKAKNALQRSQRSERVREALPDVSLVELAVAEYLTRQRRETELNKAPKQAGLDVASLVSQAEDAMWRARLLMARIVKANDALHWSETKGAGSQVRDSLIVAHEHAIEGWRNVRLAGEALNTVSRHMPREKRGPAGTLGRLTFSPDVALYLKLLSMWEFCGLTSASGDSGDGIELFLYRALEAAGLKKRLTGGWMESIRERAKRALLTEDGPP